MAVRWHSADLATFEIIEGDIPFSTWRYSRAKNRPGGWSAQISHRNPKASRGALTTNARVLWAERDGVLLFGGILRQPRVAVADSQPLSMTVGGDGWFGYWYGDGSNRGRFLHDDRVYVQDDQFDIAENLINYTKTFSGTPDIEIRRLGPSGTASGVLRDRTYFAYEQHNIGQLFTNLAQVINGFEFDVDYRWDTTFDPPRPTPILSLHYPRRGRRTDIVFEQGANVEMLDYAEDGFRQANDIWGTGQGEGDDQLVDNRTATALISPSGTWPRLEAVYSHSDVKRRATLVDHNRADLARFQRPPTTAKVRIVETPSLRLGSFTTGDDIRLLVDDGWLQVNSFWTVDAFDATGDENGKVSIDVELSLADSSVNSGAIAGPGSVEEPVSEI